MSVERWQSGLSVHHAFAAAHDIAYLEGGNGPSLLLLHGFGADKDTWIRMARSLPHRHIVALDLPGFGESSISNDASYDADSQAERVEQFVAAIGLTHFDLVGHSMGGAIAVAYALHHPERVSSLALFDAIGVPEPELSAGSRAIAHGANPLFVASPDDFDRLLKMTFFERPWIPGPVISYLAEQASDRRARAQKIYRDLDQEHLDFTPRLGELHVPVLVLWGGNDSLRDISAGRVYAAKIPGARLEIIDKCGHVPMLEHPRETADQLERFLEQART